jgi:DNA-binding HxlR family transcriptional regulator
MSERKYNQDCALARASDLLGERWTLLIVRDLLIAPRRFGELETRLKGMGTNLLAKRLKDMQHAGLVSGGEARSPYHLTEMGTALEPMVLQLVRWSLHWVPGTSGPAGLHYLDWDLLALKSLFVPDPKMRRSLVARFEADKWIAWIEIDQRRYACGLGEPDVAPDVFFPCAIPALRTPEPVLSTMNALMRGKARRLLSCFPIA